MLTRHFQFLLFILLVSRSVVSFSLPVKEIEASNNNIKTRVYFSNEKPVNGVAKEFSEFQINSKGGFVYLVVDNYPDNFTYDQIKVKIYKVISGSSSKFDDKTYNISTAYSYTYAQYDFFSEGSYIFDVYNKYDGFIGTAKVKINFSENSSSSDDKSRKKSFYDKASDNPQSDNPKSDNPTAECYSSYKNYTNNSFGFSMCIPTDSYESDADRKTKKIEIANFYGHKLKINIMDEPASGFEKFDELVVDLSRESLKDIYSSFYRKEFKEVFSGSDFTIYRSTIVGKSKGVEYEGCTYYVKLHKKKILGQNCLTLGGPFAAPSSNSNYKIIIELGMLQKLIVY